MFQIVMNDKYHVLSDIQVYLKKKKKKRKTFEDFCNKIWHQVLFYEISWFSKLSTIGAKLSMLVEIIF